jgi:hypothetical protein
MSFHPQTPQSPSQYSPSTDPTASMTSSMTSMTTALPTPAHSVNGSSVPSDLAHDGSGAMPEDSPQKRKRPLDDVGGDREQKKVQIEDRRLGIENLHLDVGEKYLLCRTRKAPLTFACGGLLVPARFRVPLSLAVVVSRGMYLVRTGLTLLSVSSALDGQGQLFGGPV